MNGVIEVMPLGARLDVPLLRRAMSMSMSESDPRAPAQQQKQLVATATAGAEKARRTEDTGYFLSWTEAWVVPHDVLFLVVSERVVLFCLVLSYLRTVKRVNTADSFRLSPEAPKITVIPKMGLFR